MADIERTPRQDDASDQRRPTRSAYSGPGDPARARVRAPGVDSRCHWHDRSEARAADEDLEVGGVPLAARSAMAGLQALHGGAGPASVRRSIAHDLHPPGLARRLRTGPLHGDPSMTTLARPQKLRFK